LTRVTYQDGTYREYLYEIATFLYALTGIVDENGDRYATFGYASGTYNFSDGKVIATQHAQTTNGVPQEKFTIVYNSATKTTVTDPAGNVWVYNFQQQHIASRKSDCPVRSARP
jgi:hypothetical protein